MGEVGASDTAFDERRVGGRQLTDPAKMSAMVKIQLAESDIISFHNYGWRRSSRRGSRRSSRWVGPILCTEYMARGAGSTFDGSLPIAKQYNVGAINWGLVAGKTQTYLPWDSWQKPYVTRSRRCGSTKSSGRMARPTGRRRST